jgi:adenylate cyclase class 2
MSYEIEQKFRVDRHEAIVALLVGMAAEPGPKVEQEDAYLRHPSRDFATSGEALRVRRVGDHNAITYKGPRHQGPTKTREEIEIPFAAGAESLKQMLQLFETLGFRPVAIVRKVRTPYHLDFRGRPIEVVLDVVEGLGAFVEVEIIVEAESDLPGAQGTVLELSAALGLKEIEPRSYLRMILESRAAAADN